MKLRHRPNMPEDTMTNDNILTFTCFSKAWIGIAVLAIINHKALKLRKSLCYRFYPWMRMLAIRIGNQSLYPLPYTKPTQYTKWSFLLRISSVIVTKYTISCGFGHIYWKILNGKHHFLCIAIVITSCTTNTIKGPHMTQETSCQEQ